MSDALTETLALQVPQAIVLRVTRGASLEDHLDEILADQAVTGLIDARVGARLEIGPDYVCGNISPRDNEIAIAFEKRRDPADAVALTDSTAGDEDQALAYHEQWNRLVDNDQVLIALRMELVRALARRHSGLGLEDVGEAVNTALGQYGIAVLRHRHQEVPPRHPSGAAKAIGLTDGAVPAPYRIALDGDASAMVVLKAGDDFETYLDAIFNSDDIQGALKALCETEAPAFYTADGALDDAYAQRLMTAFLENGSVNDIERQIEALSADNESYYYAETYRHLDVSTLCDGVDDILIGLHREMAPSKIRKAVYAKVEEAAIHALREADTSRPLDMIPELTRIEMCYIPGLDKEDLESLTLECLPPHSKACGMIVPGPALERFLRLVNLSSDALKAALKDQLQGRLEGFDRESNPGDFPHGAEDYDFERLTKNVALWRGFHVAAHPSRPALMTAEQALVVMDNARGGYGLGVPCVGGWFGFRQFIDLMQVRDDGQAPSAVRVAPSVRSKILVGLHDFINGAGYMEDASAEITLPATLGCWKATGGKTGWYGLDIVYGLVTSKHAVDIKGVPAPAPHLQAKSPMPLGPPG